tara:strand:+ start:809 stop:958 length:150 start_codon:yes stop_codon:yes gene_type:complete
LVGNEFSLLGKTINLKTALNHIDKVRFYIKNQSALGIDDSHFKPAVTYA